MATGVQAPARLASEDVIINAPLSFAGSAQRIMRLRRSAPGGWQLGAITALAILLIVLAWAFVLSWYLLWGFWLVPYRILRRGSRKRTAESLRHRELLGTIQGAAIGSAAGIVSAGVVTAAATAPVSPTELIGDADREAAILRLREHNVSGRLTVDELATRIDLAHRARTRGDLATAQADLPVS